MSRPVWKGHITFGLVSVPITLYSAEQRTDIQFRMLDSRNQARVRYERVNAETGEEVPWDEIVKGFEYDEGSYVLLSKEDFKEVAPESSQSIELEQFVEGKAVDYVYFDKPYYLVPGKKGEKGYVLLRETLRRTGKVGIARVVIRSRQYLAALLAEGDALILDLMRFQQELRQPEEFALPRGELADYKVTEREVKMAEQLVESMTDEWHPEQFNDEYRERLMAFIEAKVREQSGGKKRGKGKTKPEPELGGADVIDMMELLKQSVEKQGGARKPPAKRKPAAKSKSAPKKSSGNRGS